MALSGMVGSPTTGWCASLLGTLLFGCGPARPVAVNPPPTPPRSQPTTEGIEHRSPELKISDLKVDPAKSVRIQGVVMSIVGTHLGPAKLVFRVSDSKETITVLLNQQVNLKEGSRIELVGRYKRMPSPAHQGPGEPPWEAVFEVERFLDLR